MPGLFISIEQGQAHGQAHHGAQRLLLGGYSKSHFEISRFFNPVFHLDSLGVDIDGHQSGATGNDAVLRANGSRPAQGNWNAMMSGII